MDYIKAHKRSINNKPELESGKKCGCFHCLAIFNSLEITNWLADKTGTAICPYCNMDTIVGESEDLNINEKLLKEMHTY